MNPLELWLDSRFSNEKRRSILEDERECPGFAVWCDEKSNSLPVVILLLRVGGLA